MLNSLISNGESTNSIPKLCTVCVNKGWKLLKKKVVLSCMGVVGVINAAMAATTIA